MRALFGAVSLLIVLAIVGLIAVRQLKAVGHVASLPASAAIGVNTATLPQMSGSGSVRDQSRELQKQVTDDVAKALKQGATRTEDADKP